MKLVPMLIKYDYVELAIWFHDFVYEPGAANNETQSATQFQEIAIRMGLKDGMIQDVMSMIVSTAHGVLPTSGIHYDYLLDIDLAILGALPLVFEKYDEAIRKEYASVPDDVFNRERAKILRGFLDRPAIYRTKPFHKAFEQKARANITQVLKYRYTQVRVEEHHETVRRLFEELADKAAHLEQLLRGHYLHGWAVGARDCAKDGLERLRIIVGDGSDRELSA